MLLSDEWMEDIFQTSCKGNGRKEIFRDIAKAQLIKSADVIDSMTADGWYLEDIVKAMRKEAG